MTIQIAAGLCSAHAVYTTLPFVTTDSNVTIGEHTILSKDLSKFLKRYQELVLFGVTIGPAIIAARDTLMQADPAAGVIYDAVGSEMVEEALNIYQAKLTTTLRREGKTLAQPRYSPGYGDCAIQAQDVFFKHLPMNELGVTLTPAYIMRPEKSITAFAGINY